MEQQSLNHLEQLYQSQISLLQNLENTLDREKVALDDEEMYFFYELSDHKQQQVVELETLKRKEKEICADMRAFRAPDLTMALSKLDPSGQLSTLFEKKVSLTKRCTKMNLKNGLKLNSMNWLTTA